MYLWLPAAIVFAVGEFLYMLQAAPGEADTMNLQTLIEALRQSMIANQTHDAILNAALAAIPLLLVLWIIHRMRHRERSFLNALGIALLGLILTPLVSVGTAVIWVRTGGRADQAVGIAVGLYILGLFIFRWWLRSAPRAVKRTEAVQEPAAPAIPASDSSGEVAELRAEVARLRAERQERTEEYAPPSRQTIH